MNMSSGTILVVDDDAVARQLLADALRKEGYEVEIAGGGADAIALGCAKRFDVVLTDIKMGEVDGLAVLREFRQHSPETAIVLLTAFGSMDGAVEAIKQGAYDYLAKPFKKQDIKLVVRRSLEHSRLVRENARIREELRERHGSPLIGSSPVMLEVYKLIARVSSGKSTVLLEGESGTGKELVAQAIHTNSPRRDRPFVPVNCAALQDTLLESELFGHEKGAFTGAVVAKQGLFEAANQGTLFLDEIGDIGPALQVKLLRVIQEQEVRHVGGTASIKVDVRIVAATNRDLAQMVKDGKFREDLFYRLNVVRIVLPPLRERREDIPMLAHHFLQKVSSANNRPVRGFVPETMALLEQYHWPGNVRELENVIERTVSLAPGPLIMPDDLPEAVRKAEPALTGGDESLLSLDDVEKRHLARVLKETGGNKVRAAKILGIDRRTLYRMAERFGMDLGEDAAE
jgi:two-component system, NtrC family, response regulator AtoC